MNQEDCIRLIGLYKSHSFLWDRKDKSHHNRSKKEAAWKKISAILDQPVFTLKSKMKTLMGTYRSEKSREKKSRMNGANKDAYESKWFAYKYFHVLKEKDDPNVILDPPKSEESQELITDIPPVASTPTIALQDGTFLTPTTIETRKRKRTQDYSDSDEIMDEALHILRSSFNASNDPYFIYALNLANELRKYDAHTLAYVKRAFANVLFEADVGRMPSYPARSYDSNPHPQQVPLPSSGTSSPHDFGSQISSGPTSPAALTESCSTHHTPML